MTSYVTPFTGQSGAGYTQNKPLVDTFNGDDELSRLLGVTNSSLLVLSKLWSVSIGPTANNVTWVTWVTYTIPSLKNETQLHDYNPVPVKRANLCMTKRVTYRMSTHTKPKTVLTLSAKSKRKNDACYYRCYVITQRSGYSTGTR